MLNNIRIVLLHTSHPGNIGSVARAMKNMGLEHLVLVAPKHYPHPDADARASGAIDMLLNATVVATLDEAIADCQLVIGSSARERSLPLELLTPRECSHRVHHEPKDVNIAILFGEERIGLTNEQMDRCHYQVMIPASETYPSLNLAAAVQIIAYELRLAAISMPEPLSNKDSRLATAREMEMFYQYLERLLISSHFLNPEEPKRLMPKLRRLFARARLESEEINIVRGMMAALSQVKQ